MAPISLKSATLSCRGSIMRQLRPGWLSVPVPVPACVFGGSAHLVREHHQKDEAEEPAAGGRLRSALSSHLVGTEPSGAGARGQGAPARVRRQPGHPVDDAGGDDGLAERVGQPQDDRRQQEGPAGGHCANRKLSRQRPAACTNRPSRCRQQEPTAAAGASHQDEYMQSSRCLKKIGIMSMVMAISAAAGEAQSDSLSLAHCKPVQDARSPEREGTSEAVEQHQQVGVDCGAAASMFRGK